MQPKENQLIELLSSKTAKIVYGAVLLGAAWGRFESKMSESAKTISEEMAKKIDSYVKKLDEHIISDGYEKKAIQAEVTELRSTVNKMQEQAEDFVRNEYIRPDEVRPQPERRRKQ